MATPYWNPAATYGAGQRLWLPPWVEVDTNQAQEIGIESPARADSALVTSIAKNRGVEIDLTIPDYLTSPAQQATALGWLRDIWSALAGREFTLNVWSTEGWEDCVLLDLSNKIGLEPYVRLRARLRIYCPHPISSLAAGISWANLADYQANYPFADVVGLPTGDVDGSTPADLITPMTYFSGTFHGKVAETAAGDGFAFTVPGSGSDTYRVTALQVTQAQNFLATGSTVVTVSSADVGGGGDTIASTLADSAKRTAAGSTYFDVAGGSTVYAFVSLDGDHSDVQFQFAVFPV